MNSTHPIPFIASLLLLALGSAHAEEKHLFILAGQSNMAGLNPDESFTPTVAVKFGKDKIIVVKDAQGGQPIRRWDKKWEFADGDKPEATGGLYDKLMTMVRAAIEGEKIKTVTFLWMQGEKDAREKHGAVYARSLSRVLDQLGADLGRKDINVVIGRLSDFDMKNAKYPHWTMLREVQVKFADTHPRAAWVDTDDLNDGKNRKGKEIKNDLHYSAEGYKTFGTRLAEKAIELIGEEARLRFGHGELTNGSAGPTRKAQVRGNAAWSRIKFKGVYG